jgi:hypothetical protein
MGHPDPFGDHPTVPMPPAGAPTVPEAVGTGGGLLGNIITLTPKAEHYLKLALMLAGLIVSNVWPGVQAQYSYVLNAVFGAGIVTETAAHAYGRKGHPGRGDPDWEPPGG